MGAVPFIVLSDRIAVDEVVTGNDLAAEIRMTQINTRVDDGDDHVGGAGSDVPGCRRVHQGQIPLIDGIHGIIRNAKRPS